MSGDLEQNKPPSPSAHGHSIDHFSAVPHLPQSAICHLAAASKRLRQASDWNLNLTELPPTVREKLADFDADGECEGGPS